MGKKKKNLSSNEKNTFVQTVLGIFKKNPSGSFNYKQIAARLGINDRVTKDLIRLTIEQLYMNTELVQSNRGKYRINSEAADEVKKVKTSVTGKVDMKQTGKAYVMPEDKTEDVFVSSTNTNHALHGDIVKVFLFPTRKGHKREGEITEILQRNKRQFVGIIEISKNFAFLAPDSSTMPVDLFIPVSKLKGAKNGQKVVAVITEWPAQSANPFAEVIQVLGKPGENEVEMKSILAEIDFPLSFSEAAEKEAAKFPEKIPENEIKKRRDFREVITITIDPEDAKDFDDAISLKYLDNGHWEVGIHIADVSYYVKPGSAIEQEAQERGTSVYMVGRTIPMLPERLSNGLCSLKQGEDRLCFSA
ncbi:MAG: RNB domain-containing ribonuclease, partial [Bacteroidota bacterium]